MVPWTYWPVRQRSAWPLWSCWPSWLNLPDCRLPHPGSELGGTRGAGSGWCTRRVASSSHPYAPLNIQKGREKQIESCETSGVLWPRMGLLEGWPWKTVSMSREGWYRISISQLYHKHPFDKRFEFQGKVNTLQKCLRLKHIKEYVCVKWLKIVFITQKTAVTG